MKTVNILMVCLGNICRSPLAEGLLAHKLSSNTFTVDSAGTAAYHTGNPPDPRSIAVAAKYGTPIDHQKARPFQKEDFQRFDRIYVMDRSNYNNLKTLEPTDAEWGKVALLPGEEEVPDPYYGGTDGFEMIYQMIDSATDRIANELLENDH